MIVGFRLREIVEWCVRRPALQCSILSVQCSDDGYESQTSQDIVKSTQGLIKIAPLGNGYPSSLKYIIVAKHNPPPAESPAKTIFSGGILRSIMSRMYEETASWS